MARPSKNPYSPPKSAVGPLGPLVGDQSGIDEYEGEAVWRLGKTMRTVGVLHFLLLVQLVILGIGGLLILRSDPASAEIPGLRAALIASGITAVFVFASLIAGGLLLQQAGVALEAWHQGEQLMHGFARLRAWLILNVVMLSIGVLLGVASIALTLLTRLSIG
jgi:hypothetical protein